MHANVSAKTATSFALKQCSCARACFTDVRTHTITVLRNIEHSRVNVYVSFGLKRT